MVNRSIDITAKIANLSQLQEQLKKLSSTVQIKAEISPVLDQLFNSAKKGLSIKVSFNVEKNSQLQQILNLAEKGLNINVKTNTSSTGGGGGSTASKKSLSSLDKYMEQEQIRLEKAYADSSRDRRAATDRQLKDLFKQQTQSGSQVNGTSIGSFNPIYPNLSARGANVFEKEFLQQKKLAADTAARFDKERRAESDRQLKQAFQDQEERANTLTTSGGSVPIGSFSSINPALSARGRKAVESVRIAQEKQEQEIIRANRSLELASPLGFAEKRQAFIEKGLPASSLKESASLFNPNRLKDSSTAEAVLFSGLLGGPTNAIGGAIGGSVLGGPSGVLAGTAAVALVKESFDRLVETLKAASEAGVEFERTVAGVSGIIGVTSNTLVNGRKLEGAEALSANNQIAFGLATSARKSLVPIGISGEEEAQLANAFIQARASQGFLPSEGVAGKQLERFGAFFQTEGKDISGVRRSKDLIDILTGAPQAKATSAGVRLKNIAPELFSGKVLNDEELEKATRPLDQYVNAIKNGNEFIQQRLRLEGELSNLQLSLGESLNKALVPGFKAIADALADPKIESALTKLGTNIGGFVSYLLRLAAELPQGGAPSTSNDVKGVEGGVNKFLAAKGIKGEVKLDPNAFEADFFGEAANQLGAAVNSGARSSIIGPLIRGFDALNKPFSQQNTSESTADASLLALNEKRSASGLPPLAPGQKEGSLSERSVTTTPKASEQITQLLQRVGLTNKAFDAITPTVENNPFFQKAAGQTILDNNIEGGDAAEIFKIQNLGLTQKLAGQKGIAAEKVKEIDTSTIEGQIKAAKFKSSSIDEQISTGEALVASRQLELDSLRKNKGSDAEIQTATSALQQVESQLAQTRALGAANAKELLAAEDKRIDQAKRGRDTRTFEGQREQLQRTIEGNNEKLSLRKGLGGVETEAERRELLLGNKVAAQDIQKSKLAEGQAQFDFGATFLRFRQGLEELSDKSIELGVSMTNAVKAIGDFDSDTQLRASGRQGQLLASADKLQAANNALEEATGGVSVAGLPRGIDSRLVKGSANFDPVARARFELEAAQNEGDSLSRTIGDPFRVAQEEKDQKEKLEIDKRRIKRQIEIAPVEEAQSRFGFFQQTVDLAQKVGKNTAFGKSLLSSAQGQLPQVQQLFGSAGINLGSDFNLNTLLGGSDEDKEKAITKGFNRFTGGGDGDKQKTAAIVKTVKTKEQQEAEFKSGVKDLTKDLAQDARTLSSLTKGDLTDAISSGATIAMNNHFS